jgi:uncharacterized protein involved in propanediol utilization
MALDERDVPPKDVLPSLDSRLPFLGRFRPAHATPSHVSCSVMAHWGEIIQGPVVRDGQPQIGLVTLPDPTYWVTASAIRARHGSAISCQQPWKVKAHAAARLVIDQCAPGAGVQLDLHSTIPEGVGAGSSTADCIATVSALRALFGTAESGETHALDVVADVFAAEGPCDPLILLDGASTLLWGSRSGTLLKRYDLALPAFRAVGFVTEPGRTVSTVALAARQTRTPPTAPAVDAFAAVLRDFEHALAARSGPGVARAATASGSLNQSHCAIDGWEDLTRLAETVGALGLSCAHSGTAVALLFDPAAADLDERCDDAVGRLQEFRVGHVHQFQTDAIPPFWSATHELRIQS